MFLALGCAIVVLTYAFVGRPSERADAAVRPLTKTAAKDAPKPLVRTDPGINPWVERDIPPPKNQKPRPDRSLTPARPHRLSFRNRRLRQNPLDSLSPRSPNRKSPRRPGRTGPRRQNSGPTRRSRPATTTSRQAPS